jgi:hypothetical protein
MESGDSLERGDEFITSCEIPTFGTGNVFSKLISAIAICQQQIRFSRSQMSIGIHTKLGIDNSLSVAKPQFSWVRAVLLVSLSDLFLMWTPIKTIPRAELCSSIFDTLSFPGLNMLLLLNLCRLFKTNPVQQTDSNATVFTNMNFRYTKLVHSQQLPMSISALLKPTGALNHSEIFGNSKPINPQTRGGHEGNALEDDSRDFRTAPRTMNPRKYRSSFSV